jgi:SAM-dependent methyltransferase
VPASSPQLTPSSPADSDNPHLRVFKDDDFDLAYPKAIRDQSPCHWSPVNVCRLASKLLVREPLTRVLDIGCGPGKFCAIGATTTPGHFTGVEQRQRLVRAAQALMQRYQIKRVEIVHGNITTVDFLEFDAFYLFNPFAENVFPSLRIDFEVELEARLHTRYTTHVREQLSRMPKGTRVVTYCGDACEIPAGYECETLAFEDKLKLWVKKQHPPTLRKAGSIISAETPTDLLPAQ